MAKALIRAAAAMLVAFFGASLPAAAGAPTVAAVPTGNAVSATPALVRQVQFMLSSIGIDPGPIDGVPRQLTNAAVHKFEQQAGLPAADLVSDGQISTELLDHLRKAASGVLLGTQPQQPGGATAPTANVPPPAVAAAPPHPPPVDRFASCQFDAADFLIGGTQYTPDSFLQAGFAGSTAKAVASLKDRLQEAREVAQQIGGPALQEVQRQARVLSYFECRLKIEEGAAAKN
jgi:peptidoglycan hydrolase-like protein with peptidoglycan-binding domain